MATKIIIELTGGKDFRIATWSFRGTISQGAEKNLAVTWEGSLPGAKPTLTVTGNSLPEFSLSKFSSNTGWGPDQIVDHPGILGGIFSGKDGYNLVYIGVPDKEHEQGSYEVLCKALSKYAITTCNGDFDSLAGLLPLEIDW